MTTRFEVSPLVQNELDRDRAFHPNLGGVTRGGIANHYPMTLLALHGLGASDAEVEAFKRAWPRQRARIDDDLHLVDRHEVTVENWTEYLGDTSRLPEFRRVFSELLAGSDDDDDVDTVLKLIDPMKDSLPMGLFHPIIRIYFATLHGDRGLIADALAYMAIRYFDLYRSPKFTPGSNELDGNQPDVRPRTSAGSIRICEELCANPALHRIPNELDVKAVCAQAIRLYVNEPSLTTLHAVTAVQALAHLTVRATGVSTEILSALWARYWVWLSALYIEKGRPDLNVERPEVSHSWAALSARARAIPEVHLIKMVFSLRWLDETFGDPLYKFAAADMIEANRRAA